MRYWNGNIIGTKSPVLITQAKGIFNLAAQATYKRALEWPRPLVLVQGGLAGKFFNGSFRDVLASGSIGVIPLSSENNSSHISSSGEKGVPTGYNSGVNIWNEIDYGDGIGNSYGFIAIGYFLAPETGTYTFYTASDDGSAVWVGTLALEGAARDATNCVVNNGIGVGQGVIERSGTITLTAGVYYPIRVVHEETLGGDALRFSWKSPSGSQTDDLSQQYYYASADGSPSGDFF